MQRYPRLVFEGTAWRVPLTDQTASVLLNRLVAVDAGATELSVEQAFLDDPVLVTWCALRARETANLTFGCIRDLCNWFDTGRLLSHLRWHDAGDACPLAATDALLGNWRAYAAVASRLLVVKVHDPAADRSFFRRALSCGAKWLATCGERPSDLHDGQLAARVAQRLRDIGASLLASDLAVPAAAVQATRDEEVNSRWSNTQLLSTAAAGASREAAVPAGVRRGLRGAAGTRKTPGHERTCLRGRPRD